MKKKELVLAVASYYRSMDHSRWHLKPKEKKLIEDRIDDGYSLQELKMAIDGLHQTEWNIGNNPSGKKYLGLYYALHEEKIDLRIQTAQDHIDSSEREKEKARREAEKTKQWEMDRNKSMESLAPIDSRALLRKAMRNNNE